MPSVPEVLAVPVGPCPVGCGEEHQVQVTVVYAPGPAPILFGGKVPDRTRNIDVSCPVNGRSFQVPIALPEAADRHARSIVGLVMPSADVAQPATFVGDTAEEGSVTDWRDTEYQDWIKNSVTAGRDFCKAMVTASAGAVPVYFVLLKYLGFEHAARGWSALAVVPPVLLLATTAVFADALRPRWEQVDLSAFAAYRHRRIRAIALRTNVGMAMFVAALAAASVLALALIRP